MARLSWKEIVDAYPEQWVRLEDVEWAPEGHRKVESAIVTRVGEPTTQDLCDAMDGKSIEKYTNSGIVMHTGIIAVS